MSLYTVRLESFSGNNYTRPRNTSRIDVTLTLYLLTLSTDELDIRFNLFKLHYSPSQRRLLSMRSKGIQLAYASHYFYY